MADRKYALIKIAAGDYLLPSNDATALYRLSTYEDGPSFGLEFMRRDRKFWRVTRYSQDDWQHGMNMEKVEDWNLWADVEWQLDTRKDAIEAAMREGTR